MSRQWLLLPFLALGLAPFRSCFERPTTLPCLVPVQLRDEIVCREEVARYCPAVQAGDLVARTEPCELHPKGMKNTWRWVYGLPLVLDRATPNQLAAIPGVSAKQSAALVAYRNRAGLPQSIDELTQVPGIGTSTVAVLKKYTVLGTSDG